MLKHGGKEDRPGSGSVFVVVQHLYMMDGWVKTDSDECSVFPKVEHFSVQFIHQISIRSL